MDSGSLSVSLHQEGHKRRMGHSLKGLSAVHIIFVCIHSRKIYKAFERSPYKVPVNKVCCAKVKIIL